MIVEKQMECRLARETEVLGENLPHPHFWVGNRFVTVKSKPQAQSEMHSSILLHANLFHKQRIASIEINECES
jgi:hypothetical protein